MDPGLRRGDGEKRELEGFDRLSPNGSGSAMANGAKKGAAEAAPQADRPGPGPGRSDPQFHFPVVLMTVVFGFLRTLLLVWPPGLTGIRCGLAPPATVASSVWVSVRMDILPG